ncbi:MAG: hypothetical protein JNM58_03680 [Xanthomonadaceae bacterium]|nr:hypothetical protein [Xanthomonadaceae bacterium]
MMKPALTFAALAAATSLALLAASSPNARASAPTDYAERLYSDFSAASDHIVVFKLKTVAEGGMDQLEGRRFAEIAGEPNYRIAFDETRDSKFVDGSFDKTYIAKERSELDGGVDDFDVVGRPYKEGRYRLLSVTATLNGETRRHQALEFCWDTDNHCVVFDPQIELMDSMVANYRQAKAEGIGPQVIEEAATAVIVDGKAAGSCGLASNRGIKSRTLSWGARTLTYKNLYGITVVVKNLASQRAGISCDRSCMPQMHADSNVSSAWANVGFSATCANAWNTGTTGKNGKAIAETRCTHKAIGSASASVTHVGKGSGVSLAWHLSGSSDGTGGSLSDSCSVF